MRNRMRALMVVLRRLCRGIVKAVTVRARLLSPAGNLRLVSLPVYLKQVHELEGGFISVQWLEGIFVGVILLVVLITFLWQQGIPEVIEATSNTTALTDAGATSAQVNWATWIGGAIVIFLFIGALIMGIRIAMNKGGASGGGGGRRRRGKRK